MQRAAGWASTGRAGKVELTVTDSRTAEGLLIYTATLSEAGG